MNYTIGGCSVPFPHQAYGTQLSFMGKVISALENRQNALLEAPTGSGKTLSLLCASLAWQTREKQRVEEGFRRHHEQMGAASLAAEQALQANGVDAAPVGFDPNLYGRTVGGAGAAAPGMLPAVNGSTPLGVPPVNPAAAVEGPSSSSGVAPAGASMDGGFLPGSGDTGEGDMTRKVPKIYYATRTHSQIAQVVKELKRSGFSPRMAVLGSKQHYCVNAFARDGSSKHASLEETCDELMGKQACNYFNGVRGMVTSELSRTVHDIEDLKAAGSTYKACPYYLSRHFAQNADLVFGPYNYFVDPVIRRSLQIDIEGAILIFDEAHNIEDVSRESASLDIELPTILGTIEALTRVYQYNGKQEVYGPLLGVMKNVQNWMKEREKEAIAAGANQQRSHKPSRFPDPPYDRIWSGPPMMKELDTGLGLGPRRIDELWEAYQLARAADEEMQKQGGPEPPAAGGSAPKVNKLGAGALGTLSRVLQIVKLVHQVSTDGGRDFRLVLKREALSGTQARAMRSRIVVQVADDGPPPTHMLTLSLWCLYPGVAFSQVSVPAHSVILTSGTLSPLDSFASELNTEFAVKLEAPHVVNMRRQVWAGVISHGPSGAEVTATFSHTDQPQFQDSLGQIVVDSCRTIPDGVLLFLPSYSLLDKLSARWKATGAWARIAERKVVVQEPRGGGPSALQEVMEEFYQAIEAGRGALFMAVCRGKVSEGLDFADARARGVLVVGIPFPNVKDTKVNAKKRFNDAGAGGKGQGKMGLLPGSVWYEQQAFRALNQAVGRCIRHRADWGAVILVDSRFQQAKYQKGLSRWLRGSLAVHANFGAAASSMGEFFQRIQADPPQMPQAVPAAGGGAEPPQAPKVDAVALLMAGARRVKAEKQTARAATALVQPAQQPLPPSGPSALLRLFQSGPLENWVKGDVAAWSAFVIARGTPLSDAVTEASKLILCAFQKASNVIFNSPTAVHTWMVAEGPQPLPPSGLQALLACGPPGSLPVALDADAAKYGQAHFMGVALGEAIATMGFAYGEALAEIQQQVERERGAGAPPSEHTGVKRKPCGEAAGDPAFPPAQRAAVAVSSRVAEAEAARAHQAAQAKSVVEARLAAQQVEDDAPDWGDEDDDFK